MAAADDRILTEHPAGKQGTRIDRAKYDAMRAALLAVIPADDDGVPFMELTELVKPRLDGSAIGPDDSLQWYVVTVKQDLEARGLIEIIPGARPQHLRQVR